MAEKTSERISFASTRYQLDYPDFLDIQLQSFQDFFQLETNPENRKNFFKYTNWIHPKDTDLYSDIFSMGKLATRMTTDVEKVISAYAKRSFDGNIMELLEPRFTK